MAKTYTIMESIEMLNCDPKTFRRWLEKAGIDPEHQVSKADNRIRFLTQEQVELLARDHGRTLNAPEVRTTEIIPASAYKLLQDRVEDLERQEKRFLSWIERHEERLDASGDTINEHSATLDGLTDALGRQGEELGRQVTELARLVADVLLRNERLERLAAEQSTLITAQGEQITGQAEQIAELQRPTRGKKSRPATAGESAALPGGSLPARTFAEAHTVTRDRMEGWIAAGQIETTAVPYGRRIQHQVTPDQQAAIVAWWDATRTPYDRCPDCPHATATATDQGHAGEEEKL